MTVRAIRGAAGALEPALEPALEHPPTFSGRRRAGRRLRAVIAGLAELGRPQRAAELPELYARGTSRDRAALPHRRRRNLAGALPGFFDSAGMYVREFGRPLADPVMVAVYRGAWGTALLYGFGFLLVAYDPPRHWGVVLMGGVGKALFAVNLAYMFAHGWTSDFAVVVIVGDALFVAAFLAYFRGLRRAGHEFV